MEKSAARRVRGDVGRAVALRRGGASSAQAQKGRIRIEIISGGDFLLLLKNNIFFSDLYVVYVECREFESIESCRKGNKSQH